MRRPGARPRRRAWWVAALLCLARTASALPRAGVAHVFAYSDELSSMVCNLARSVEAAGGRLNVFGLRDGRGAALPGGPGSGYEHLSWMVKKNWLLLRALRRLPANATVVAIDAFDVLFQRPLSDLVAAYRRLAAPTVEATGAWPVIYGGELNCWPFPHDGRIPVRGARDWVHTIPADSMLAADHTPHLARRRFPVGESRSLRGDEFCSAWLSSLYAQEAELSERSRRRLKFPFLCSGAAVGTVSALRRFLREFLAIHTRRGEYDDQAIISLILMRNRSLGFLDTGAEIFLQLHGHDEFCDLERPLCRGSYFAEASASPGGGGRLSELRPPAVVSAVGAAPSVLHFNGNGKRHLLRCVEEFRAAGVLGPESPGGGGAAGRSQCAFIDHDRGSWVRMA